MPHSSAYLDCQKAQITDERSIEMTVIITHGRRPRRDLLHADRLVGLWRAVNTAWARRQTMRALEALPPETLKDIGWPTTDKKATRIVR